MNTITERLNQIGYTKVVWLLAVSETIHNLEEAIWLPAFSQTAAVSWQRPTGAFEFRFADTLLTLMIYGVIYYFSRSGSRLSRYLMGGALVGILFNVFVPHLAGTVTLARYAPGTVSGVLLNIPVILYLIRRGMKEGFYDVRTLVFGGIIFMVFGGYSFAAFIRTREGCLGYCVNQWRAAV